MTHRLRWLALFAVAALALACGEDEPPPEPPGPPPTASLETIDLCGANDDTAAMVREQLVQGGVPAAVSWFRQNVTLPANLRTCGAVQAEPTLHERVLRLEVYRMTSQGTRLGSALELGESRGTLPLGVQTEELTVYPDDPARPEAEGVRVTISSLPE